MKRTILVLLPLAILLIASTAAAASFNFDGEDYCADHQAWPNGSWLGQFHPWHQQHYINVFGREAACPNWANDQRNSALSGLRELGYVIREPQPASSPSAGYGRILAPAPDSTAAELRNQAQDAIVRVATERGSGTGFIFDIEQTTAFVVTNHHVIDRANAVDVQVPNGITYKAIVLGWNSDNDVAVLAICCDYDFAAIPWEPAETKVSEEVVAIGFPRSTAGGLVATTGAITETDALGRQHGFVSHSAPLNPGNSGGPLFSVPTGKVIGINTARNLNNLVFYSVPYQSIASQVSQWRSQLAIAPAPDPRPDASYPVVRGERSSFVLNEFKDPVAGEAAVGKRLVAIDVTQTALASEAPAAASYFKLQDAAGYIYEAQSPYSVEATVAPLFDGFTNLTQGLSVRGWVVFEIPSSAVPSKVIADVSWDGAFVIATLR